MKRGKTNRVKIVQKHIYVSTNKINTGYTEIPLDFIETTYWKLYKDSEVTQEYLSETLNVKDQLLLCLIFTFNKLYRI